MMKRKIISIDDDKCVGCGVCIPNCPEGAIQMIDNKARLISDLFCDGLGACLGHCPVSAITIEEREAEPYDERKVMVNIIRQGPNTIKAHLEHLKNHGQTEYLDAALEVLKEQGISNPLAGKEDKSMKHDEIHSGCPGSRAMNFAKASPAKSDETGKRESQLTHWPVQLHLVSPMAPYYKGKDVLLSADCVAYALGDFHKDFLKDKSLAIACPKLDDGQEVYVEKIKALIDDAKINTLTVMMMEVPCCMGLLQLAKQASEQALRKVPIKSIVVGLQGDVLKEEWM
jgi:ferredoxin